MDDHPAVTHPVVVVGLGPRGRQVAHDLAVTADVRPSGSGLVACGVHSGPRAALLLRRELEAALGRLLEAGRVHGARDDGRARLDLVVVADLVEVEAAEVELACDTAAQLLSDSFGVLFPSDSPPDKRSAWMGVVLATPALMPGSEGQAAADALCRLERWAQGAPHPACSRIWVVPRQTTAGQLTDEAVEQSLRLLAQALYLSGVRSHDEVRTRLAHRGDGRWLATASVAAAELPVARLRKYARWRAAWDGFSTLVRQAEHPSLDHGRTQGLLSALAPDELLEDLEEGRPAQLLRRHAAALTGLSDRLPARITAGLLETDASVRGRHGVLFERTVPEDDEVEVNARDHADVLRGLDEAEVAAVSDAQRRVDALLESELDPATALQVLPDLEAALDRALLAIEPIRKAATPPLPRAEPPARPDDPELRALEEALASRPRLTQLLPVAGALALVVGVVAGTATLALSDPSAVAAPALMSTAPTALHVDPWLRYGPPAVGLVLGIGVATAWVLVLLSQARARLVERLIRRRSELEDLWTQGGAGQPGRKAAAVLEVRRRRTAEGVGRVFERARTRLDALRAALRQGRTRALAELDRLDVRLADVDKRDDLRDLLGAETPLHRALLPASVLAERISASRVTQDADRWAQLLLESTWPRGGIGRDLPALDDVPVARVCDAQFDGMGTSQLLQGPEVRPVVESRLRDFLGGVGGALAFGVRPRDEHGDPVRGSGPEQPLVIAPLDLRVVVEEALAEHRARFRFAWGTANTPWVVVVHTRDGLTADEIARGMGVTPCRS